MSEEHEPYITSTGQAFEVQRVSRLDARLFKPFRGDGGTALSDALTAMPMEWSNILFEEKS